MRAWRAHLRYERLWEQWRANWPDVDITARLGGARLTFGFDKVESFRWYDERKRRRAVVVLELQEAVGLDEWERRWVGTLVDMLVLLNREQSVVERFEAVFTVPKPAPLRAPGSRPDYSVAVEVLRRRFPTLRKQEPNFGRILLNARTAGPNSGLIVERFFKFRWSLEQVGDFLFSTLNGAQWLENQLLNLLSFAEAYHARLHDKPRLDPQLHRKVKRALLKTLPAELPDEFRKAYAEKLRYADKQTQRTRLTELLERALDVLPEVAHDWHPILIRQLIDTRNYLTHGEKPGADVVDGHGLAEAVRRLVVVLEANVLLDMGVDEDAVFDAITRSYSRDSLFAASA